MAQIGGISSGAVGGTYLQALRTRGAEQVYSVKDNLEVKFYRDSYVRSDVSQRWLQFQGGDGWQGAGASVRGQPYAPWQPYRRG